MLPELKPVIEVFERHGYTAYDRQIDAVLTPSSSFLESASSFVTTATEAVRQMQARGEIVIGYPREKMVSRTIAGMVLFIIASIVIVLLRQQAELPPNMKKELRDLQERISKP